MGSMGVVLGWKLSMLKAPAVKGRRSRQRGEGPCKASGLEPDIAPRSLLGFDEASTDGGGIGELGVGRVDGVNGVVETQEVVELVEGDELMAKEVAALMFVQPRNKIRHE